MYPNFPSQVMEMEEAELYINAMMHYLGRWFGVRILPNYEKPVPFFIPHSKILEIPFFFGDDALLTNNSNFNLKNINMFAVFQ